MKTKHVPHRRGAIAIALGLASLATGCQSLSHSRYHPAPRPPHPTAALLNNPERPASLTPAQEADVQVALGRTLEKKGEVAKAMTAYQEAIRRDAGRADAYLRMAILHDRQGRFAESAVLYQQALATRPGDPDIYSDKGYSLYLQRRWVEAEMSLRQAIVLQPDHPRAHNNLGLVLAHSGRLEPALSEFRKGGCTEADAQINLAYALTLERQWPAARRHFQLALVEDATSEPARVGLLQLDRLTDKVPAAPPVVAPRDAAVATVAHATAAKPAAPAPAPSPPESRHRRVSSLIESRFSAGRSGPMAGQSPATRSTP